MKQEAASGPFAGMDGKRPEKQGGLTRFPAKICRKIVGLYFRVRRMCRRRWGQSAGALVRHAELCRNMDTVYIWGGLGALITPQLLEKKWDMYPDHYPQERRRRLLELCGHDVRGFDCCGLIKNFLMGGMRDFCYEAALDMNAEMLLARAEHKGSIETLPEMPGLCLYMEGHVGVYMGEGMVTEATSNPKFGDGVVQTKLQDRDWLMWFACPTIRYRKLR